MYFGTNGKLVNPAKAVIRKEIHYKSPDKPDEITFKKSGQKWERVYSEQIKILKDQSFRISSKGSPSVKTIYRYFSEKGNGVIAFKDISDEKMLRSGYASSMIPLILHGEVIDYYGNGKVRAISQFRNNELISNRNWLENGDRYIDSIFYSVDEEPLLSGGNFLLHQRVRKALDDSGLDFLNVNGNLLLGFVITEDGEMTGIRVMKSLGNQLDNIAVKALKELNGKWTPARLDGRNVRYFQLFPINFIYRETRFQSLEFDGSMLHYDKY